MLKEAIQSGNISSKGWDGSIIHAGRDDVIKIDNLGDLSGVVFSCAIRETKRSSVGLVEPSVSVIDESQGSILIELTKNQTALLGKGRDKVWLTLDALYDGKFRNFYEGMIIIGPQGSDIEIPPADTPIETLANQVLTAIADFNASGGASASGGGLLGQINSAIFSVNTASSNEWKAPLWSNPQASYWQPRGNLDYPKVFGVDRPFALIPANTPLNQLLFTMCCGGISVDNIEVALCVMQTNGDDFSGMDMPLISDSGLAASFDYTKKLAVTPEDSTHLFGGEAELNGVSFPKNSMAFLCVRYTGTASGNVSAPFTVTLR